ncbi:hypothetical protein ACFYNZ_23460 [Streptomyces kebangsaanensis]|uniref:Transposase IS111A/IS1328/IS1533 N-terminal domain-containing protein n=1 Tax=Streptomyces kebangsaanensis TaxID=864058 RepID=A0ABW6L0C0_9ACTN
MPGIRVGADIGRTRHHRVVVDADGGRLLSRRVLETSTDALRAVGPDQDGAALPTGLLLGHDRPTAHLTGLAVHRAPRLRPRRRRPAQARTCPAGVDP